MLVCLPGLGERGPRREIPLRQDGSLNESAQGHREGNPTTSSSSSSSWGVATAVAVTSPMATTLVVDAIRDGTGSEIAEPKTSVEKGEKWHRTRGGSGGGGLEAIVKSEDMAPAVEALWSATIIVCSRKPCPSDSSAPRRSPLNRTIPGDDLPASVPCATKASWCYFEPGHPLCFMSPHLF